VIYRLTVAGIVTALKLAARFTAVKVGPIVKRLFRHGTPSIQLNRRRRPECDQSWPALGTTQD
jgi:hypothetical protein